ncbi:methyltransferase [Streptosporangium sp. NPDC051023]|uniref:methyltransferase n=1 Tax=Streptosporangium sp. NPDC051023 TaxID=3155410 RepID=UPI00344C842A
MAEDDAPQAVRPVPIADRAALPVAALLQVMLGYWVSQSLCVVAHLGVADVLRDGPRQVDEIAAQVGADPGPLYRVMRALATAEVFEEHEGRAFALTPVSEPLVSGLPGSVRALALWHGASWHWGPWGDLLETVRGGDPAFDRVHGCDQFAFFAKDPAAAEIYHDAMSEFSTTSNLLAAATYDGFEGIDTLVDVGGGRGEVLCGLLGMHGHLRGVLVDLPAVVEAARETIAAAGLEGRCEVVAGDYFATVPDGHAAYMLSMVVNDWDDEHATAILRTVRRAMREDSVLLLLQMVVPPADEPSFAKLMDLEMLVHTGGRERTEEEFRMLLEASGFELERVVPTISPVALLVVRPRARRMRVPGR